MCIRDSHSSVVTDCETLISVLQPSTLKMAVEDMTETFAANNFGPWPYSPWPNILITLMAAVKASDIKLFFFENLETFYFSTTNILDVLHLVPHLYTTTKIFWNIQESSNLQKQWVAHWKYQSRGCPWTESFGAHFFTTVNTLDHNYHHQHICFKIVFSI